MISMEIEFVKAKTEEEICLLCETAERVWHETYDALLPKGQADYMIEKFQSEAAVKNQLRIMGYIYYLLECKNECLGFLGFAPRYEAEDELFLSKLYLLSEFHGMGAAREAFAFVTAETKKLGLLKIRLTVNKWNTHAVEVYKHEGFEITDAVVSDIGSGYVMDDYIMTKRI